MLHQVASFVRPDRFNSIGRVFVQLSDHEEKRMAMFSGLTRNYETGPFANSKSKYMDEIVAKSRFVSDVNESNVIGRQAPT